MAQETNAFSASKDHPPLATDASMRDKLIGVWSLSATNPAHGKAYGQWMSTETTYRRDGTFEMHGSLGTIYPDAPKHRTMVQRDGKWVPLHPTAAIPSNGSGVWHIDHGFLCSTYTNGNWQTNVETCFEIQSLTDKEFTYRKKFGNEMGPILKAIPKR